MDVFTLVIIVGLTAGFLVYSVAALMGRTEDLHEQAGSRAGSLYATIFVAAVILALLWTSYQGAPWGERLVTSLLAGAFGAFEAWFFVVGFDYVTPERSSDSETGND